MNKKLLAVALLLGGCAPHQPPQSAPPSPASTTAPHKHAHPTEHATEHAQGDGAPASPSGEHSAHDADSPAAAVSLDALLAYADEHSPLLAVARATRSRAEASRTGASVLLPQNPTLTVGAGPRFSEQGTGVDLNLGLSQQVQIAGERGFNKSAAERAVELTEAEIEELRWNVHCDVHAGFHRALVEAERQRLAERVVVFQREVLSVVERQIEAGETAPLSLRLAQAEAAQAAQVLVAAEQSARLSRIELARMSGWSPHAPPTPAGGLDAPIDPQSPQQLYALAQEHLPRLRTASARIRAAEAAQALQERRVWPNPTLGVNYSREGNVGVQGPNNIVMGVVSLPIPSFQRNQGARAETQAEVTVREAELNAQRQLLEVLITAAQTETVSAAARTRAYGADILPHFEENLALLRRSFELGEIDILALSTGRERFLRIQSDALSAQLDYFNALANLERIVGVDLWHEDHLPTATTP